MQLTHYLCSYPHYELQKSNIYWLQSPFTPFGSSRLMGLELLKQGTWALLKQVKYHESNLDVISTPKLRSIVCSMCFINRRFDNRFNKNIFLLNSILWGSSDGQFQRPDSTYNAFIYFILLSASPLRASLKQNLRFLIRLLH